MVVARAQSCAGGWAADGRRARHAVRSAGDGGTSCCLCRCRCCCCCCRCRPSSLLVLVLELGRAGQTESLSAADSVVPACPESCRANYPAAPPNHGRCDLDFSSCTSPGPRSSATGAGSGRAWAAARARTGPGWASWSRPSSASPPSSSSTSACWDGPVPATPARRGVLRGRRATPSGSS